MFRSRTPSRTAPTARLSDRPLPSLDGVQMYPGREVMLGRQQVYVRATPAQGNEAALFVHGLGGSAINWTDYAALLRDDLDIEMIDLPGFGRAGKAVDDDYSLPTQARVVIDYLEQSGRGPVHLVGNSMGGAIAILVAARRPDLVRTLTLVSPAVPDLKVGRVHALRTDWRMALLIVPILGAMAMRKLGQVPIEVRVKATMKLCLSDVSRLPKARLDDAIGEARERAEQPWIDDAMLRATRAVVRSQLRRGRGWAAIRAITAPTLVVWGDEDKLVAPDLAPFVAAAIPDSRLLVLEHVGHVAMIEMPDVTARATRALVEYAGAGPAGRSGNTRHSGNTSHSEDTPAAR